MKKTGLVIILCVAVLSAAGFMWNGAHRVKSLNMFGRDFYITCGFGPRKITLHGELCYDWHNGLDFGTGGQHRLVRAVEAGKLVLDTTKPYNTIIVGRWMYLHCQNNTDMQAYGTSYTVFCGKRSLYYDDQGDERKTAPIDCIVVSQNSAVKELYTNTSTKKLYLKEGSRKVYAQSQIAAGTPFAVVSNVGPPGSSTGIHLHFQTTDVRNPLGEYPHQSAKYIVSIVEPFLGKIIRHSEPETESRIFVFINTRTGLDLNEVKFYLTRGEGPAEWELINWNTALPPARFYYAGDRGSPTKYALPKGITAKQQSYASYAGSFTKTQVAPIDTGLDEFYYTYLNTKTALSGQDCANPLDAKYPDGEYRFVARAISINGVSFDASQRVILDNWRPQIVSFVPASGGKDIPVTIRFTEQIDTSRTPKFQLWNSEKAAWFDLGISNISWQCTQNNGLKDSELRAIVRLPDDATGYQVKCRILDVYGLGKDLDVIQPADSEKDINGNDLLLINHRPAIKWNVSGEIPVTVGVTVEEENLQAVTFILDEGSPGEFACEVPVIEQRAVYQKTVSELGIHTAKVIACHEGQPVTSTRSFYVGEGGPEIPASHAPQIGFGKRGTMPVTVDYNVDDWGKDFSLIVAQVDNQAAQKSVFSDMTAAHFDSQATVIAPGLHTMQVFARDQAGNTSKKRYEFYVAEPGSDVPSRPDESFDVSGSQYGETTGGISAQAGVGILQSGYWQDTLALINSVGQDGALIRPEEFSEALASRCRVLLVPSGGLQPLSNLGGFKDKLSGYVEAGGNIIVMAQIESGDYAVVPGPVSGMGYMEDTACHNITGSIVKYAPCFAGQRDAVVDGNADGVVTLWPQNAEIWLRRIKNGFPALMAYPIGRGRVVLSTYYSDFAYGHSQLHDDERRLLRDLVAWFTAPNCEIPEIRPGEAIELSVPVSVPVDSTARIARVLVTLKDPNGKAMASRVYDVSLGSGQTTQLTFPFDDTGRVLYRNGAGLGIWSICYELYSTDGLVQSERVALRTALSEHLVGTPGPGIAATVVVPERSAFGRAIPIKLILANNDARERTITCKVFESQWFDTAMRREIAVTVPAMSTRECTIDVMPASPNQVESEPTWYRVRFEDETGAVFATELRTVYVFAPRVNATFSCTNSTRPQTVIYGGQPLAAAEGGDRLRVEVDLVPANGAFIAGQWHFEVKAPDGTAAYTEEFDLELGLAGNVRRTFEFTLPGQILPGLYTYSLTCDTGTGKAWMVNQGPRGFVGAVPELTFSFKSLDISGDIRVECANHSPVAAADHLVAVAVCSGVETELASVDVPETAAGQSGEVVLHIDPTHFYGDRSSEQLVLKWGSGEWWQKAVMPMPYVIPELYIRQWSGQAGAMAEFHAGARVMGRLSGMVDMALKIPDAAIEHGIRRQLVSSSQVFTEPVTIAIPESLSIGVHAVALEVVSQAGVLTSTRISIEVKPAKVNVSVPAGATPGGQAVLNVVNSGGKGATALYTLTMFDRTGLKVTETSGEIVLPVNDARSVNLSVAPDLIEGNYRLEWSFLDKDGGRALGAGASVLRVAGTTGRVEAEMQQSIFGTGQAAQVAGRAIAASESLEGGTLHMEVRRTQSGQKLNYGPGWPQYGGTNSSFVANGAIDFATPGYRWRWNGYNSNPAVGRVLPGERRQVVTTGAIFNAATGQLLKNTPVDGFCYSIKLVDADGDGVEEILRSLTGSWITGTPFELFSATDGTLWRVTLPGYSSAGITAVDLNGDGTLEGFAATTAGFYLLNLTNGQIIKQAPSIYGRHYVSAPHDLNGDGRPELLLLNDQGQYYSPRAVCIAVDADLKTLWQTPLYALMAQAQSGDIDGDSVIEVVVTMPTGIVALDARTGRTEWTWFPSNYVRNNVLADLTADGVPEVIVGHEGGVQVLLGNGQALWSSRVGESIATVVHDSGSNYILTGSYCIDADTRRVLWRRTIYMDPYAVADVDGDERLEIVNDFGCIDAFDPIGTTTPVQSVPELVKGAPSYSYKPYRAEDGSLWLSTGTGFSYYDPVSGQFGNIPMRTGFPYLPVLGCWFKNAAEGLNVYSGKLDWVGTIDTRNKKLLGEHQASVPTPNSDPYPDRLQWEGKYYGVSKTASAAVFSQDASNVSIPGSNYASYSNGVVGVGPNQTVYALFGSDLFSYSFGSKTYTKTVAPVAATQSFAGSIQVSVDRALAYIPTSNGQALYSFNPLNQTFTVIATEQELHSMYRASMGASIYSLNVALVPGSNGSSFISLSGSTSLPCLYVLPGGSNVLQPVGAFLGWTEIQRPQVRSDGIMSFVALGAQPKVKTVQPGGASVFTDLPFKPWSIQTALAPNGDYCIIEDPNAEPVKIHRVSRTGQYSAVSLERQYPTMSGFFFDRDPDLFLVGTVDGVYSHRISSDKATRLTVGNVGSLAPVGDGRIIYSVVVKDAPADQYIVQPGSPPVKIGSWATSQPITVLGVDKGRIVAVTESNGDDKNLELWTMDLGSGKVTRLGEADPSGIAGARITGVVYSPADRCIYYARGADVWRWDALDDAGPGSGGFGAPGEVTDEVVWSKDVLTGDTTGSVVEHAESLTGLEPGQYSLKVSFTTERGQELGQAACPFAVGETAVGLVRGPEGTVKVGSPLSLSAEVSNLSAGAEELEAVLTLEPQGKTPIELRRLTMNIGPGQTQSIPFTVQPDEPMTAAIRLELLKNGKAVGSYLAHLKAAVPAVEAGITAPAEVGREPFTALAWVRNAGELPVSLTLNSQPFGIQGETVNLTAGEEWRISRKVSLEDGSSLVIHISGDWAGEATAAPVMVEKIWLNPDVESTYPDGVVAPELLVANTGKVMSRFEARLTVSSAGQIVGTTDQEVSLAPGQGTTMGLPLELPPGTYVFSWQTPFGEGEIPFAVAKRYAASITGMCGEQGQSLVVNVDVANQGLWPLDGQVEVRLGSDSAAESVSIAAGQSKNVALTVPLPLQAGNHAVSVRMLVNGQGVSETAFTYVRAETVSPEADIRVESLPAEVLAMTPGEPREIDIVVKNGGLAAGQAIVGLAAEDLPVQTELVSLAPGEQRDVRFSLVIPIDRESGTHSASILVNGEVKGEFSYSINGIKLTAEASTDKAAYQPGETVQLTLQVAKVSGPAGIPLTARVKWGAFEESRPLTLSGSDVLTFTIPAADFSQKLFYGFYQAETERSLYLDTIYICEESAEALVLTDKQVYNPGELVTVEITPHIEGLIAVEGPGGFAEEVFAEEPEVPIVLYVPLPAVLPSGTYSIRTTFADKIFERRFDVKGVRIELIGSKLSKASYAPGERVEAELCYAGNSFISGTLLVQGLDPAGKAKTLIEQTFSLVPGKGNRISIVVLPTDITAGIHPLRLVLKAADGTQLTANTVYFKVGSIDIERIDTAIPDYPITGVPVTGSIVLTGAGSGTLGLTLGGQMVMSMPVQVDGFTPIAFTIPAGAISGPGKHRIDAALTCGTETTHESIWFNYGIDLPDLVITEVAVGLAPDADGRLPVQVELLNLGKLDCAATIVELLSGEEVVASGALPPVTGLGGTGSVHLLWDIRDTHGQFTVTARVNPEGVPAEFDRSNNVLTKEIWIPARPSVGPIPDRIGQMPFLLTGSGDPGTLVVVESNGSYITECPIDSSGFFRIEDFRLEDGLHNLTCHAVNAEGRVSMTCRLGAVLVDTISPEIRCIGVSDGLLTNKDVQVKVEANDSNLSTVRVTLDGGECGTEMTISSEGSHTLRVDALDIVGHSASVTVTFTIDKTPPAITVTGPVEGGCYEPSVIAHIQVEDSHPGEIQAYLDGRPYLSGIPIETLGSHTLAVRATDKAGNNSEKALTFTVRPSLEAGLFRVKAPRVLVFADGCRGEEIEVFTAAVLSSMGIPAHFAYGADEFAAGMQSGEYNDFIILDGAKTTDSNKGRIVLEKLRQRVLLGDTGVYVYAGAGGDTTHYFGRNGTPFPGQFTGFLPPKDRPIYLTEGLTPSGNVTASGKCIRIELQGGEVLGTAEKNGTFPVVYKDSLGEGTVAVIAFNPAAAKPEKLEPMKQLLATIIQKAPPSADPAVGRLTAFELNLQNPGAGPVALVMTPQLSSGVRLIETFPVTEGVDPSGAISLSPGESIRIRYFVTGDSSPASLKVAVDYLVGEVRYSWGTLNPIAP